MVETTRRREIEAVASELFHERGYAGTSVRDIARALDIQGASLYAHVASKEEVLWTIVDRTASRFESAAEAAVDAAGPDATPAQLLDRLIRAHVGVVTEDVQRASVFVREWRSLAKERRTAISRRRDAYEGRFRAVVAEGTRVGDFDNVDPAAASAFLLTALNGLVAWYRPDGRLREAAIADAYAQLGLGAVGSATPIAETVGS